MTYAWRSEATRLDSTVFPMSTIKPKIFWFVGSGSVAAVLNFSRDMRFNSGSRVFVGNSTFTTALASPKVNL